MSNQESLLRVEDVSLSFGAVQALIDVSLEVCGGEILAIIGPNGAGKTSLLNVINGVYRPQQGRLVFMGRPRPRNCVRITSPARASPAPSRTWRCSRA